VLAAAGEKSWGEAVTSIVFAALGCVGLGGARGIFAALKTGGRLLAGGRTALTGAFAAGKTQVAQSLSRGMMNALRHTFKGWKGIGAVGRAGEKAAGIAKNTTRVFLPGVKGFRVPDALERLFLTEVKNCQYLELTGRVAKQFEMFSAFARSSVPPRQFVLYVRSYTEIGPQMAQFIQNNGVVVAHISDTALFKEGLKEFGSLAWQGVKGWLK
jgi:hypothetical protein